MRSPWGESVDVLGPLFAEIDSFPTRVRLPDGPLQLVDRITLIEGEPRSMTSGRVVTEHDVRPDRWYLEAGRIPTAISVESRAGRPVPLRLPRHRLPDPRPGGLPAARRGGDVPPRAAAVGETIVYDIRIDEFFAQGDTWLFRFRFDGTVNGEPFMTMRNGVAGFFTAEALAAGKGIVQTALDKQPMPGKRPADWRDSCRRRECSLAPTQVEALRAGDLVAAFGPDFAHVPPDAARDASRRDAAAGRSRAAHRPDRRAVRPRLHPGRGRHPPRRLVPDLPLRRRQVMPGTLMYECCLHTLRVFLMRMGWVGEDERGRLRAGAGRDQPARSAAGR